MMTMKERNEELTRRPSQFEFGFLGVQETCQYRREWSYDHSTSPVQILQPTLSNCYITFITFKRERRMHSIFLYNYYRVLSIWVSINRPDLAILITAKNKLYISAPMSLGVTYMSTGLSCM